MSTGGSAGKRDLHGGFRAVLARGDGDRVVGTRVLTGDVARASALRITAALVLTPNVFCKSASNAAVRSSTSKLVTAMGPLCQNGIENIWFKFGNATPACWLPPLRSSRGNGARTAELCDSWFRPDFRQFSMNSIWMYPT